MTKLMNKLLPISGLDYAIIFTRHMQPMREFYKDTLGFPVNREFGSKWVEFNVGQNSLTLTESSLVYDDPLLPIETLSVHLTFFVPPADMDACIGVLKTRGVRVEPGPSLSGYHTFTLRDPDNNLLKLYPSL